jgi:RNA polymerase sigma factor (sigma-70 family)
MAMTDHPSPPATVARPADASSRDEHLLSCVGRAEPGADRAFVCRFQRRVYALAWTIVGDQSRAEEIAVDALSRACLRARDYDPSRGTVATWVLGITRERAVEDRRRRRRGSDGASVGFTRSASVFAQLDTSAADDDDVDGHAATVRFALSHVPIEQRRALVLAAVHGYTAQEISQAEAVSVDVATARMRAGVRALRGLLSERGA